MCAILFISRGQAWWLMAIIPVTLEVEIGRIMVQCQPQQKVSEITISINKLGVVIHVCNQSYV
jgi:hypothetical protein